MALIFQLIFYLRTISLTKTVLPSSLTNSSSFIRKSFMSSSILVFCRKSRFLTTDEVMLQYSTLFLRYLPEVYRAAHEAWSQASKMRWRFRPLASFISSMNRLTSSSIEYASFLERRPAEFPPFPDLVGLSMCPAFIMLPEDPHPQEVLRLNGTLLQRPRNMPCLP